MKQWYALRSKPKRESSVVALLERTEVETYLPQVVVRRERGKSPVAVPFFPSYLFARFDPLGGEIRRVRYTRGVLQVVSFGDEPCPVPDDLILLMKERFTRTRQVEHAAAFRPGDRVVVTAGQFKDMEAVFDCQLSASGRVRVLIQLLHRACKLDMRVDQVRLLGKATSPALAHPGFSFGSRG
jgi:transcriptional antiterminator RfaH